MKNKIALLVVLVAGLTASTAIATPTGKHRGTRPQTTTAPTGTDTSQTTTTTTTPGRDRACRVVRVMLRGRLESVATDGQSFAMHVRSTNRHGRWYRGLSVTVRVDSHTRVWRLGEPISLGNLKIGEKLNVGALACRRNARTAAPPLALHVVAGLPEPQTTPTTTTTTTTTTSS